MFTAMDFRRALFLLASAASLAGAQARHPPLDSTAIGDIARLLLLEDVRHLDTLDLARLLASTHPEVLEKEQSRDIADRGGVEWRVTCLRPGEGGG